MAINSIISNATPLFPLGSPRSGTTILARILNSHPQILMTDETSVILQISESISKSKIGRKAGVSYGRSYPVLWADFLTLQSKPLIEGFYERIAEYEGKQNLTYWGDKHPHHSHGNCLEFINTLYPQAKYIYIVRDPRDMALSLAKMKKIGFMDAMNAWKKYADKYEAYFDMLDKASFFLFQYEDLVSNYKGKSADLLRWLGLPYTAEVDNFIDTFSNIDVHTMSKKEKKIVGDRPDGDISGFNINKNWVKGVLKQITGVSAQKNIDFKSRSVNKWESNLSRREKLYALGLAGDYIDKYGYER